MKQLRCAPSLLILVPSQDVAGQFDHVLADEVGVRAGPVGAVVTVGEGLGISLGIAIAIATAPSSRSMSFVTGERLSKRSVGTATKARPPFHRDKD
jgi:hypothetical protein